MSPGAQAACVGLNGAGGGEGMALDAANVAAAVGFDGVHAGIGGADDGVDGGSV